MNTEILTLDQYIENDLKRSNLGFDDLELNKLVPEQIKSKIGMKSTPKCMGGYEIIYRDYFGNLIEENGIPFSRIRILGSEDKELPKYLAPPVSSSHLYIPKQLENALKNNNFLVITEGEKKAVAACKANIPCVAIAGVTMFRDSSILDEEERKNSILPELKILIESLDVESILIMFDSDGRVYKKSQILEQDESLYQEIKKNSFVKNKNVRAAAFAFLDAMRKNIFDKKIGVAFATPVFDNSKTRKRSDIPTISKHRGIDDMLVDGENVLEIIKSSLVYAEVAEKPPFIPLGITEDGKSIVIWSNQVNNKIELSTSQMNLSTNLVGVFNKKWLEQNFPDEKASFSVRLAGDAIVDMCAKAGVYNEDRDRGYGVWKEKEKLIINTKNNLYELNENKIKKTNRIEHQYLYIKSGHASPPDYIDVSEEEGYQLITKLMNDLFNWNYQSPASIYILLGFIVNSIFIAANDVRPHIWVVGPRGCGKTTLLSYINSILKNYAIYSASAQQTSANGIRQFIAKSAVPILIDEAERSGSETSNSLNISNILSLLRASYSSEGLAIKGTANQKGTSFSIKTCAILGSIADPELEPADMTRTAIINLNKLSPSDEKLVFFTEEQARKLFWFIVKKYSIIKDSIEYAKQILLQYGRESREAATYGTFIGCAVAITELSVNKEMIESIIKDKLIEFINESSEKTDDSKNVLDTILQCTLSIVTEMNGYVMKSEKSIAQILSGNEPSSIENDALQNVGIRLYTKGIRKYVAIASKHTKLSELLRNTIYKNGWSAQLKNIKNAKVLSVRVSGNVTKCVVLDYDYIFKNYLSSEISDVPEIDE